MPSDKFRRDFAPEQTVIEELDKIPLMKRSRVINQALTEYFEKQKTSDFSADVLKQLQEIKMLIKELIKSRK